MFDLSRRQLLAGAAAAGAATALTSFGAPTARAAVPPAGAQAPGFYRYKVGSYECTSINDGVFLRPIDNFVRDVPKEQAQAAADAAYMPQGMVAVPFNPQLINTGSKLVLIDCGNGVSMLEPSKGRAGRTLQNLAAAGVDPKSIDIVLMSHLHPDHTNGIRAADGSMAFPNAEIMVPAKDWEFWTSDENAAKAQSNEMMKNYFANVKNIYAGIESKVTKTGARRSPPASPRSRPPATRPAIPPLRWLRAVRRSWSRPTSPTFPNFSCAIPTGTVSTTWIPIWRRRPATNSMTWRQPRRPQWSASTSPSPRSAMSRRTAANTG
jgi:Metallo-beta-lactamase superfamily